MPEIRKMKKFAVIVAGGSGSRMGSATPKQFLLLNDKPILYYTLESFLSAFDDIKIVLVVPSMFLQQASEMIIQCSDPKKITLCEGGVTRFQSVKNGLQHTEHPSVIFVHDGVRCLVSTQLIRNCYKVALEKGSAVPAVAVTDSIRKITANGNEAVDRSQFRAIQTPQTFRSEWLLPAFQQPYKDQFTDEATVVEAAGHPIHLIEGEKENIKITYPYDALLAEQILKQSGR